MAPVVTAAKKKSSGSGGSPSSPDAGLGARLDAAMAVLAGVVSELDPGCLTGGDATRLYTCFAGFERLAVAGKALLAPRIEASGIWREGGHANAAVMLASLEGVSAGQAKHTLTLGHRLDQLPATEEAARRGMLSAPKLTELTGAGVLDPAREPELLDGAAGEPLQLVRERCHRSRATSRSADPLATLRQIRAARHFSSWTDADGAFCYQGRDTADRGAQILAQVGRVATRLRRAQKVAGAESPESERAVRADAFFALVTRREAGPGALDAAPDPGPAPPASRQRSGQQRSDQDRSDQHRSDQHRSGGSRNGPPRARSSGPPGTRPLGLFDPDPDTDLDPDPDLDLDADDGPIGPDGNEAGPSADSLTLIDRPPTCSVVVRVDHAALLRGHALEGECCEIDGQGPIPVPMARAMANDSFLRLVFHRAGDIRAVSHLGRTINRSLRTALVYRDRTCVVPGCGVSFGLEIDHLVPFAEGGPTELENLALVCHHHHYLKTYENWTLTMTGTKKDGTPKWSFESQPSFGQEPELGMDGFAAKELLDDQKE